MYSLKKTQDPLSLEISFDYFESIHPLGPFGDIITEYARISGAEPIEVDFLFNFKFYENGQKIQFYWNNGFTIYVMLFGRSQYRLVYDRLSRICSDLNRQLAEKRYQSKKQKYRRQ